MFQNKGLENLNCARLILGNADIPSSGSGTIDIKSSNPNYPITINGVLPTSGGGGSYTDAQAITALTNSTSPYIVDQTMNGNLSVDDDLSVTTGNLYVDAGDITVSVGDLQLQTGNLLNIPSATVEMYRR